MLRLVAVLALLVPATASADTFKLFGELHAGGMYGQGTSGAQKDSDFFQKSPNALYGFLAGAELLFLDGWIEHHQFTDGSRLTTWTQFGLGVHFNVDTGDPEQIKHHEGPFFEFGGGLWYGIGTGQQVMPPLDYSQLTDQAFMLEARLGLGLHLNKVFDFGFAVPVSYGYFFKTGTGANNTNNQYRGWEAEGLLVLRGNLRLL